MTPEQADEVLRAMRNSLASWIAQLEALEATPAREREHLLRTMRAGLWTLEQVIDEDDQPG